MAKRRGRKGKSKLRDTAASFGTVLGNLANKVEAVNRQRAEVSKEIASFIQHAQGMMSQLGHELPTARRSFGRAFAKASKPGRKAGRGISTAARKKMSLAAKKRWAAAKAAGKNALG